MVNRDKDDLAEIFSMKLCIFCVMLNQNSQKSKEKVMCLSDNFLKTFVFNPIFIRISLFWTNFRLPFFGLIPAMILKERKTIAVTQQIHLR